MQLQATQVQAMSISGNWTSRLGCASRFSSPAPMKARSMQFKRENNKMTAVCSSRSRGTSDEVDTLTRVPAPPTPSRSAPVTKESTQELVKELMDPDKFGKRGEGWFLAQSVGILLVVFPPSGVRQIVDTFGGILVLSGLALITLGSLSLGQNLTPLPQPREEHSLVTDGVYELVRHPMYGGILISSLGLALATGSEARLALVGLLFFLIDQKASFEEEALEDRYGEDYAQYKTKSKKFFPWLY